MEALNTTMLVEDFVTYFSDTPTGMLHIQIGSTMFLLNFGPTYQNVRCPKPWRPEVKFLFAVNHRKFIVVHDVWGSSNRPNGSPMSS